MANKIPPAIDGCTCICHRKPGVKHFMACCGRGAITAEWITKMAELEGDAEIGAGILHPESPYWATLPTEPGYYWAKLKTPSGGILRNPSLPAGGVMLEPEGENGEDWVSPDWELVEVHDNNGEGDEKFSVSVFGIPVTQWPLDFYWGPKIEVQRP